MSKFTVLWSVFECGHELNLATLEYVSEPDHPDDWTLLSSDAHLSQAAKLLGYRTALA